MKTTKRIEETRTYGDPDRDDTGIALTVDYDEGNKPTSVHFRIDSVGTTRTIEEVLRIAQAIRDAGWVPEGHYVCADHGLYDARSSDSARCSRCEAQPVQHQPALPSTLSLLGPLERLLEVLDVPEVNCSCHVNGPCGDCVKYGGVREAVSDANAAIAKAATLREARR